MFYQKYTPCTALQPYVMCYYVWEQQEAFAEKLEVHSPPNGLGGMVFNYGDTCYSRNDKGRWEPLPASFIAGQFSRNYTLLLGRKAGMVGVAFLPAGLSHLLGIPMVTFTDQRLDLALVLGLNAALLEEQVLESADRHERIKVLERFLLARLCKLTVKTDVVDQAVASIVQQKGILSINRLSDSLCISPRQFRRRFVEKVGISPKLFSRIKRFNYISGLSSAASVSWMDIVHEGGYYDQAHFIRDFCDFSGKKPSDFVNYKRALAELVGA
jgi:AraC-like DNA-binding protein